MGVITYAIADDHEVFRQGLKLVLDDDPGLQFLYEAENGLALVELIRRNQPDVVLLDLKMQVWDGLTTAKAIREEFPAIRIVILTMFDEEQFVISLLEAGANGYLTKTASPEEIKKAIYTVHDNGYYYNDMVSSALLRKLVGRNVGVPNFKSAVELSEREIQILGLICREHTASEIGEKVFLSTRTVEGIRAGIMEKIGVRNIAGLVMYAVRNGIVH